MQYLTNNQEEGIRKRRRLKRESIQIYHRYGEKKTQSGGVGEEIFRNQSKIIRTDGTFHIFYLRLFSGTSHLTLFSIVLDTINKKFSIV